MSKMKLGIIITISAILIVVLAIFGIQSSQNRAFIFEEQVNTAQSDIKIQEKRRVDLIYNLVDCVKEYDKHEANTLTAIVEGRGSTGDIENVTTAITAVSEAYPELKSNENYKQLMNELSMTENLIAEYRSNYNKSVKEYNRYIRQFPNRLFLNILALKKSLIVNCRLVRAVCTTTEIPLKMFCWITLMVTKNIQIYLTKNFKPY